MKKIKFTGVTRRGLVSISRFFQQLKGVHGLSAGQAAEINQALDWIDQECNPRPTPAPVEPRLPIDGTPTLPPAPF